MIEIVTKFSSYINLCYLHHKFNFIKSNHCHSLNLRQYNHIIIISHLSLIYLRYPAHIFIYILVVLIVLGSTINLPTMIIIKIISSIVRFAIVRLAIVSLLGMDKCGFDGELIEWCCGYFEYHVN